MLVISSTSFWSVFLLYSTELASIITLLKEFLLFSSTFSAFCNSVASFTATSNIILSTSSVASWLDSTFLFVSSFLATSGAFSDSLLLDSSLANDFLPLFLLGISVLTFSSLATSFSVTSFPVVSWLVSSLLTVSLSATSFPVTSLLATSFPVTSLLATSLFVVSFEVGCSVTTGLLLICCVFWLLPSVELFSCLISILLVLVSSVTSAAWATLPIPKKIDAATATDAVPTVNFFIE